MATQLGTPPGTTLDAALAAAGTKADASAPAGPVDPATEAARLQEAEAALAEMAAQAQRPGELKWRLTMTLYPSILLIFVALYVSSLASGTEPEMALLQAGAASLVLAVLARVAVGIIADETRLVLNDSQIVAMARAGAVREYLSNAGGEHPRPGIEQPSTAAQAAGTGGKE